MLLKLIRQLVSDGRIYVKIRPQFLSVRNTQTGKSFEDIPLVAISKAKGRAILAIGATAEAEAGSSKQEYDLINGFDHPRTIVSDFTVAEKTLEYFLGKLSNNQLIKPSPVVVIHVLDKVEGGLTQVEVRALMELAAGAGAREVFVWTGPELSDDELNEGRFPGDYWHPQRPSWART